MNAETVAAIREVLDLHARLRMPAESLGVEDDLYQAGMTSHASVAVMLALEDRFDLEFPDRMLTRDVFLSVDSIEAAVTEILTAVGQP